MRPLQERNTVIIIGPPGSGKTRALGNLPGYVRFDADRVIEAVWGSLQYHPRIKRMAKGMVREGMRRAMGAGLAIAVPISGRTRKERAKIIDIVREYDYHVTVVRMVASADVCLARCEADDERPKTTNWKPIIERWFRVFEPVAPNECDEYHEEENEPA